MAVCCTAENGGVLQEIFNSRNKDKKTPKGCGNTANVLLEFMHKSNNTKRNEATQESSSHTARPPSSASLFISSRDTQRNVLLLCKNKTETTLRRDSVTNH